MSKPPVARQPAKAHSGQEHPAAYDRRALP